MGTSVGPTTDTHEFSAPLAPLGMSRAFTGRPVRLVTVKVVVPVRSGASVRLGGAVTANGDAPPEVKAPSTGRVVIDGRR